MAIASRSVSVASKASLHTPAHSVSLRDYLWKRFEPSLPDVQNLCQRFGFSNFLSRLLSGTGTTPEEAQAFLHPTLKQHLPDPAHLPHMAEAIPIITDAMCAKKTIALWGDYDVDGATSTALWMRFLRHYGCEPLFYIPDRFQEGYGPNSQGMKTLKEQGASLVITLDCGITAHAPLEDAKNLGLDVIVVDHHLPDEKLPSARAIVNPKVAPNAPKVASFQDLAAVGVSFFCLVALKNALKKTDTFKDIPPPDLRTYLDLVALGTVCDVVPLKILNRLFVKKGLEVINQTPSLGIQNLLEASQARFPAASYHLGFVLGPRLNAGGRLSDARIATKLLSTTNQQEASTLADTLCSLNHQRRTLEQHVTDQAHTQASMQKNDPIILVQSEDWHEGVIGIVASRLKDAYQKSALVLSFDTSGNGKGSGRSDGTLHLGHMIQEAVRAGHLTQGGGHKMAGGFSLHKDQLDGFQAFAHSFIRAQDPVNPEQKLFHSGLTFKSLTLDLWKELCLLEPFGAGNPEPVFLFERVYCKGYKVFGSKHLRIFLAQEDGTAASALLFNSQQTPFHSFITARPSQAFDLIASIGFDTFHNTLDLRVKDILVPHTTESSASSG